jgi:hypothetical protein
MRFVTRLALAAAFAATCLAAPARAAEPDPLLPPETEGVIAINFRQIIDSDIIKKYALNKIKEGLETEDAQKAMKTLGIDPLKDVDRVSVGFWGGKSGEEANFAGTARGKFDPEKLFKFAEAESKKNPDKVQLVKSGKYTLIKMTNENPQPGMPKDLFVAVADEKTVVMASSEKVCVTQVQRVEEGASKSALSKAMTSLILKMDDKASMYFCGLNTVKDVPVLPPQVGQIIDDPEKFAKQLVNIDTMAMVFNLTDEFGMTMTMSMKTKESAEEMGGMMEDLVGKAKAFLPFLGSQPNMKPLVQELGKTLKAKADKNDVTIGLKLSGKAIAAMAGQDDQ